MATSTNQSTTTTTTTSSSTTTSTPRKESLLIDGILLQVCDSLESTTTAPITTNTSNTNADSAGVASAAAVPQLIANRKPSLEAKNDSAVSKKTSQPSVDENQLKAAKGRLTQMLSYWKDGIGRDQLDSLATEFRSNSNDAAAQGFANELTTLARAAKCHQALVVASTLSQRRSPSPVMVKDKDALRQAMREHNDLEKRIADDTWVSYCRLGDALLDRKPTEDELLKIKAALKGYGFGMISKVAPFYRQCPGLLEATLADQMVAPPIDFMRQTSPTLFELAMPTLKFVFANSLTWCAVSPVVPAPGTDKEGVEDTSLASSSSSGNANSNKHQKDEPGQQSNKAAEDGVIPSLNGKRKRASPIEPEPAVARAVFAGHRVGLDEYASFLQRLAATDNNVSDSREAFETLVGKLRSSDDADARGLSVELHRFVSRFDYANALSLIATVTHCRDTPDRRARPTVASSEGDILFVPLNAATFSDALRSTEQCDSVASTARDDCWLARYKLGYYLHKRAFEDHDLQLLLDEVNETFEKQVPLQTLKIYRYFAKLHSTCRPLHTAMLAGVMSSPTTSLKLHEAMFNDALPVLQYMFEHCLLWHTANSTNDDDDDIAFREVKCLTDLIEWVRGGERAAPQISSTYRDSSAAPSPPTLSDDELEFLAMMV